MQAVKHPDKYGPSRFVHGDVYLRKDKPPQFYAQGASTGQLLVVGRAWPKAYSSGGRAESCCSA